jgi:hypothetical protein
MPVARNPLVISDADPVDVTLHKIVDYINANLGGADAAPQITLTGPLTYAANAAAGTLIANIGNVPAGVTPTITPDDDREVIAGDATAGWMVVVGMTSSSVGVIATTISAAGATSVTQNVTVIAAPAATPSTNPPATFDSTGWTFDSTSYPLFDKAA